MSKKENNSTMSFLSEVEMMQIMGGAQSTVVMYMGKCAKRWKDCKKACSSSI